MMLHFRGIEMATAKPVISRESFVMSANSVELPAVAKFVRQHTHDIRNHLNGLDLEAALLAEIVTDREAAESVARLRAQVRAIAAELKTLAGRFNDPEIRPTPVEARELFLIWQDQAKALGLDSMIWQSKLGHERVNVDVAAIGGVLQELLTNARQFTGTTGLAALAGLHRGRIEFELRENKKEPVDPASWGEKPFASTKRAGYGLGLWQASQAVGANGGEISRAYLSNGTLVTKLMFPLA